MPRAEALVRKALERDRLVVVLAVALLTGLAWIWLLLASPMDAGMTGMEGMLMAGGVMSMADWSFSYAAAIFVMWALMMVAMMLPSAAPVLLLYLRVSTRKADAGADLIATAAFAAGYLAVWMGFSLVATFVQWFLETNTLMTSDMRLTVPWLGAAILLVAGLWQITPLKAACLSNCRSPIGFLTAHWRSGYGGALQMGLHHGLYCLGCCWVLMSLLFVAGVMNLYWVAGVALFVALEKLAPGGRTVGKVTGVVLIGAALALALQGAQT